MGHVQTARSPPSCSQRCDFPRLCCQLSLTQMALHNPVKVTVLYTCRTHCGGRSQEMTQTHISLSFCSHPKTCQARLRQTHSRTSTACLHHERRFWLRLMCPPLPVLSPAGLEESSQCYSTSSRRWIFWSQLKDVQAGMATKGLQPHPGPKLLSPAPKSGAREATGRDVLGGVHGGSWAFPPRTLMSSITRGKGESDQI